MQRKLIVINILFLVFWSFFTTQAFTLEGDIPLHFVLPSFKEIPADKKIVVDPSQAANLPSIIENAPSGTTIFLKDGEYHVPRTIWLKTPGITLRSLSGDREKVVLTGDYKVGEILGVLAPDIIIADLTIKHAKYHAIHLGGNGHRVKMLNLHLLDCGEQLVKVNPSREGKHNDYGILAYSLLEFSDEGRSKILDPYGNGSCYTNGIDILKGRGWIIRNNIFKNIYCEPGRTLTPAILVWQGARDTIIEKNKLINCPRGIQLGLGWKNRRTYDDLDFTASHIGGIVRNNFIFVDADHPLDTGIGLWAAKGTLVLNNTVFYPKSAFASIDLRFSETEAVVWNNLLFQLPRLREGARVDLQKNMVAQASWFVNPQEGDLHLKKYVPEVINRGKEHPLLKDDIDGKERIGAPDIGADEFYGLALKINQSQMPLKITPSKQLDVVVSFYIQDSLFQEVFLWAETPVGRYCYLYPFGWNPCSDPLPSYQGLAYPGNYPVFSGHLSIPGLYQVKLLADKKINSSMDGSYLVTNQFFISPEFENF